MKPSIVLGAPHPSKTTLTSIPVQAWKLANISSLLSIPIQTFKIWKFTKLKRVCPSERFPRPEALPPPPITFVHHDINKLVFI